MSGNNVSHAKIGLRGILTNLTMSLWFLSSWPII